MSKNLQKIMASKYPTPTPPVMKDSAPVDSSSTKEPCILTPKKMFILVILLAGLFFVLALPYTFKTMGSLFPEINGDSAHTKFAALQALVFAILAFLALRMC